MTRFVVGGLLTALCALGCGETDDTTPDDAAPAGATVFTLTASGGTFAGEGALDGVELRVPAGAVDGERALWMAPPVEARPLPASGRMVGPEVLFGPETLTLAQPAELTLPFEPAEVTAAGAEIDEVKVWRVGPDGWTLEAPLAPPGSARVTATVGQLSRFGAGVEIEVDAE